LIYLFEDGSKFLRMLKEDSLTSGEDIRTMVFVYSRMEISYSRSGLPRPRHFLSSVTSMGGIEVNIGVKRMNLDAGLPQSRRMVTELQEFSTILDTRFRWKVQMENGWTETRPGPSIKCRTRVPICTIAFFGTLQRNSSGPTKDR
jgi:hypothetical protein